MVDDNDTFALVDELADRDDRSAVRGRAKLPENPAALSRSELAQALAVLAVLTMDEDDRLVWLH